MIVNPVDSFNSTYQLTLNHTNQLNQNINNSFNEEKWAGKMLQIIIEFIIILKYKYDFRNFLINEISYFTIFAKKIGARFIQSSV